MYELQSTHIEHIDVKWQLDEDSSGSVSFYLRTLTVSGLITGAFWPQIEVSLDKIQKPCSSVVTSVELSNTNFPKVDSEVYHYH